MYLAICHDHVEVFKALVGYAIACKTRINSGQDHWLCRHLLQTCAQGRAEMVQFLLDRPVNPNCSCYYGDIDSENGNEDQQHQQARTALFLAIDKGHVEVAKLLLAKHARVPKNDFVKMAMVQRAAAKGRLDMVEYFQSHPTFQGSVDNAALLILACQNGSLERVKDFVKSQGVDAKYLVKPLYVACKFGHLEVVMFLVENGADTRAAVLEGWQPPLWVACRRGFSDIAKVLLENGADVDVLDEYEETPLLCAINYGQLDMVELLLGNGASVYRANEDGELPLFCALSRFDLEGSDVVRALIIQHCMTWRRPASETDEAYSFVVAYPS